MTRVSGTTEIDIRSALHRKRFRLQKANPGTLIVDELGLAHAKCRVDIAVVNGSIHGYEIKSCQDTLDRLGSQLEIYRQTLQKLTIVAASKHLPNIVSEVPEWCGLIEVVRGPRGGVLLQSIRNARPNPEIDPVMLAHLLWRPEVVDLLTRIGYSQKELRRPRKELYEMLCEVLTLREVTGAIHEFMLRRRAWPDRQSRG